MGLHTAQRLWKAKKFPSATASGGRGAVNRSRWDLEQACSAEDVYFWHFVPLCWSYVV